MLASALQQRESATKYVCSFHVERPSRLHPIPALSVVTEHWAEVPVMDGSFPPALCFTRGRVHMSMLFSRFLSLLCPKFILYVWVSTPTCPADGFISIIFLDSTYMQCLYEFCFSLSDLCHSELQALGSFISWELAPMCSFLWLSNIPLCIQTISPLSIHLLKDISAASMSYLL